MRSLFLGILMAVIVAMPPIVRAEQMTVSAGKTVTVTGSDISSWAAADIYIGEGATLLFEEPNSHFEFTGKITGSGHFVASSAVTTTKPYEFKMNGDATGFTGGFFYTNVLARIVTPTSVGDSAKITIYVVYNTGDGANHTSLVLPPENRKAGLFPAAEKNPPENSAASQDPDR